VTLDDLGNIGEFVGAIGVIVSFVYLAIQIRQNTRTIRTSNYESVMNGMREYHALIAQDGELADIYMRGSEDLSSLEPREIVRLHAHVQPIHEFRRGSPSPRTGND